MIMYSKCDSEPVDVCVCVCVCVCVWLSFVCSFVCCCDTDDNLIICLVHVWHSLIYPKPQFSNTRYTRFGKFSFLFGPKQWGYRSTEFMKKVILRFICLVGTGTNVNEMYVHFGLKLTFSRDLWRKMSEIVISGSKTGGCRATEIMKCVNIHFRYFSSANTTIKTRCMSIVPEKSTLRRDLR